MPTVRPASRARLLLLLSTMLIASCSSEDHRLADYAERATQQQARQNVRIAQQAEAVAQQTKELSSAAHELVAQDAAARRDLIQAQEKIQEQIHAERTNVDRQREQLDVDRKTAALE